MLTINELRWLVERKLRADEDKGFYYCRHCQHYIDCANGLGFALFTPCPTSDRWDNYKDAAKFEAKVASIIPRLFELGYLICNEDTCPYIKDKCDLDYCSTAEIRQARLLAEMCDD